MKKIKLFSLIAAALFAGSAMAADVTLFTTNFSTADGWSTESIITSAQTTNTKVIKGTTISFKGYKKSDLMVTVGATESADGTLTFTGNNIEASAGEASKANYYMAIPISNVNGTLTVTTTGDKTKWYYSYDDGNKGTIVARAQASENYTFTITGLTNSDVTVYIGSSGKKMNSITFTTPEQEITTEPECPSGLTITGDAEVYAGDKMTLAATLAAGNGEIAYQWYKDGTAAENAIAGATGKTYVVESFSAADAGSYYCRASKEDCEATINAEAFAVGLKEIKNITCETDKYVAEVGTTIEDNMTITTPSVKLTFGEGAGWYAAAQDNNAPADYSALIVGANNPKVSNNVPTSGCFYKFEVSKSATLNVAVKVNGNKSLYVVEGTESIGYTLTGQKYTAGSTITTTTYDILSFEVAAETSYYVYCVGSKLGIYGFEMPSEDGPSTAVEQAQVEAKAVKVIRDGQLLIIREGRTYTAQGVELR